MRELSPIAGFRMDDREPPIAQAAHRVGRDPFRLQWVGQRGAECVRTELPHIRSCGCRGDERQVGALNEPRGFFQLLRCEGTDHPRQPRFIQQGVERLLHSPITSRVSHNQPDHRSTLAVPTVYSKLNPTETFLAVDRHGTSEGQQCADPIRGDDVGLGGARKQWGRDRWTWLLIRRSLTGGGNEEEDQDVVEAGSHGKPVKAHHFVGLGIITIS
ncbi:hypothetical protein NSPZN2_40782 [Nitrospira defluvii]|uniref:Uncharacterized protein n=1 Tax=Nitrospira defluvii TaxID=330214 RepID=A0ABM8S0G4_9BACT|nr:hypothetical protein NSPZN2_40782 [Nitrospira defluvii]